MLCCMLINYVTYRNVQCHGQMTGVTAPYNCCTSATCPGLAWSSSWAVVNMSLHVCYSCTGWRVQFKLCWITHSVTYAVCDVSSVSDQHRRARWCRPYTFPVSVRHCPPTTCTAAAHKVRWTCVFVRRTICMERTARSFACRRWPRWVPKTAENSLFYCIP